MKSNSLAVVCSRALCLVLFLMMAVTAWGQSFTVSASPSSVTIHPGDQNVPVRVTVGASSYTGPINIALTDLPSGITVSPLTLTAGSSGTINLSAAVDADQEAFPASSAGNANTKANKVTVVGAAGSVTHTSTLTLTVSLTNPSFAPSQLNLPIVRIDTGGTPIVDKTTDVPGTITITSSDGSIAYLPSSTNTDNTGTFHLHGNSTISMPKKPYHVKLTTSLDLLNVMGLSCPYITSGKGNPTCDKSKSFILLANYDDKSLLRDWSASALANAIPIGGNYLSEQASAGTTPPSPSGTAAVMPWAPHSLFVELYLNGAYEGNYQLIEEVKVDSHRVNITELAETDITDDITGGYLLEIDHRADEAFIWKTPKGVPIGLIDPDFTPDPEVPEQTSYIKNYVDQAETALYSSSFTNPTTGWRNYFDEASAVNFYIVNDVMGNVDGGDFFSSDYLYKAIDNQYLYMGPIWDFDISSGNVNYEPIYNPTVPWMQTAAPWYKQWFKDPAFKADVIKQWNALQSGAVFTNWIASINAQASGLQQSQANNFARWPMLGERVWPNPEASSTYDAEVAYLTNWLTLRIAYLDSQFNGRAQTKTTLRVQSGTLRGGTPVQLSATASGGTTPTGTISFMANGIVVGTASLTGGAASGSFNLLPGKDALTAVYSGDSKNGLSASTAQTVTVVGPLLASATSLSASTSSISKGASVSFPISVLGTSGSAVATGSVALTVNGNPLGSIKLSAGKATFKTEALPAGADQVQANYGGDTNYSASSSPAVTVTVSQGGKTTPVITWANPASITYGVLLSGTQLNATANVAGSFVYSPAAGTLLSVGTHSLSSTFTPTNTANYNTAAKSVSITVVSASGGSCTAPTSPGVVVCSPANGSTVSSPVKVQAAAAITGSLDRMEVWVDGVKKYTEKTSKSLSTSITLAAGKHQFDFYAVNTAGTKWEKTVSSTVK
jgi:CotH kinase protein/Bacterial Ig-like domain (group 3)/Bacterial Ig domain